MASIRTRLLTVEEDLLDALTTNTSALETLFASWSDLIAEIDTAMQSQTIDADTLHFAHSTASRVAIIANISLQTQLKADQLVDSLCCGLEDALSGLTLHDFAEPIVPIPNPPERSSSHTSALSSPPYIAPAYNWLLKNIHNPYPSREIRALIAQDTGCARRSIDAWFVNARRRIGWTALSSKYFHRSRADTVEAAFRVFQKDDPKRPVPNDIRIAFVEVEVAVKELYSAKLQSSTLAGKLDGMVKDMTEEDRRRRAEAKARERAGQKEALAMEKELLKRRQVEQRLADAVASNPSPAHSPRSPTPSFSSTTGEPETASQDDTEAEIDTLPPAPVAGRKRRSSSEPCSDEAFVGRRPMKRLRCSSAQAIIPAIPTPSSSSSPPSTVPSVSEPALPTSTQHSALLSSSITSPPIPPTSSKSPRKRRLSSDDASSSAKRPRGPPAVSRAVSDPLPQPSDDWWSRIFGSTSSAVVDELDSSTSVDVTYETPYSDVASMFDFDGASSPDTALSSPRDSPTELQTPVAIEVPSSEIPLYNYNDTTFMGLLNSELDFLASLPEMQPQEKATPPSHFDVMSHTNPLQVLYQQNDTVTEESTAGFISLFPSFPGIEPSCLGTEVPAFGATNSILNDFHAPITNGMPFLPTPEPIFDPVLQAMQRRMELQVELQQLEMQLQSHVAP
ncbi:hypothetical protein HGRIS_008216 [Hohenbuehelia grisea]|uniref:Homeobox domain-containing protein n=1 Tax=Hohenbuehelia grisea TaxID=104357 RepID=A0ABR3J7H3_9AGAR